MPNITTQCPLITTALVSAWITYPVHGHVGLELGIGLADDSDCLIGRHPVVRDEDGCALFGPIERLIVLEQPVASAHEWQKVRAADPPDKWPCPIMTH